MQKFKNWLISALLRKDRLVAVPESWQNEYVKLAADKVKHGQNMSALMNEYNGLLKDYFNKLTIKDLQDELSSSGIEYKTSMSKQELADLAYEEFRMTIERN